MSVGWNIEDDVDGDMKVDGKGLGFHVRGVFCHVV